MKLTNKQKSKIKNGDSWDEQESVKLNWRSIPITVRRLLATCFGLTASSVARHGFEIVTFLKFGFVTPDFPNSTI